MIVVRIRWRTTSKKDRWASKDDSGRLKVENVSSELQMENEAQRHKQQWGTVIRYLVPPGTSVAEKLIPQEGPRQKIGPPRTTYGITYGDGPPYISLSEY